MVHGISETKEDVVSGRPSKQSESGARETGSGCIAGTRKGSGYEQL